MKLIMNFLCRNTKLSITGLLPLLPSRFSKISIGRAFSVNKVHERFFVNNNGINLNKGNYCRHLRKELFPAIAKVVILLKMKHHLIDPTWHKKFLKKIETSFHPCWRMASSSPDVNPRDYFYFVKTKVYEGRSGKMFAITSWTKEKNKTCLEYLCKWPGTVKESN